MRLTDRNRRNLRARLQAERLIQRAAYRQLRWLWNRLYPQLRRYNAERHHKRLNARQERRLRKQEFAHADALWSEFKDRLETQLRAKFKDGAELIAAVEDAYWDSLDFDLMLNPDDIVDGYSDQIGQLVTNVSDDTRAWVGNTVADWYKTPGSTFQELIDKMSPRFGERRAALIGTNEVTGLNSEITRTVMGQTGINGWWWQTMRDEVVCTQTLEGPDGNEYEGCADLQGHEFTMDESDFMPPDGSHIGCRCSPVYRVMRETEPGIGVGPQQAEGGAIAEGEPMEDVEMEGE
jgi:uncharacterized protein with gpF-like domain